MTRLEAILVCALAVGAPAANWTPIQAQQRVPGWERVAPAGGHQNDLQLLRPTGGPVVPIFEGWYTNADGTHQLCFGYFNVNTEEVLEIPVGRDNRVEPKEFNGLQPTHFLPVPPGGRRHYCAFSATVPADWGDQDLTWTLRNPRAHGMGQEYTSPGRITFERYRLEEPVQESRARSAPKVRLSSEGFVAVGRTPIVAGPYEADLSEPLPLAIQVRRDNPFDLNDRERVTFRWYKYHGPGEVIFHVADRHRVAPGGRAVIEPETWLESADSWGEGEAEASFTVPGDYRLLLQVYNDSGARIQPSDFEFFCCWTNVLLDVTVMP